MAAEGHVTAILAEDQPVTFPTCGSCVHDYMMDDPDPVRKAPQPTFEDVRKARRQTMRAICSKETEPEILLRRLLHWAGYRYHLHCKTFPGRPNLAFPSQGY